MRTFCFVVEVDAHHNVPPDLIMSLVHLGALDSVAELAMGVRVKPVETIFSEHGDRMMEKDLQVYTVPVTVKTSLTREQATAALSQALSQVSLSGVEAIEPGADAEGDAEAERAEAFNAITATLEATAETCVELL